MKKYRVKKSNGRVAGPFTEGEVISLLERNKVLRTDLIQSFPAGDWLEVNKHSDFYNKAVISNNDETLLIKVKDFKLSQDIVGDEKKNDKEGKEYSLNSSDNALSSNESEDVMEILEPSVEKTEVSKEDKEEDKTKISNSTLEYLEREKKKKQEEEAKQKEEIKEAEKVDLDNDSTQMINFSEIQVDLNDNVIESEKELLIEQSRAKKKMIKKKINEVENEDEDEDAEAENRSLKRIVILILAGALLFFLLDDNSNNKPRRIEVLYPKITFPQRYEEINEKLANQKYKEGISYYNNFSHVSLVKSARSLRESTEYKFNDNPALYDLIFIYSLLLKTSNSFIDDANKVFKMVQVVSSKRYSDPKIASATAKFFLETKKVDAAILTIERFNELNLAKPSRRLFAVYLNALIQKGDLSKAQAVFDKLKDGKFTDSYIEMALFHFLSWSGKKEALVSRLTSYVDKKPSSALFKLMLAENYISSSKFQEAQSLVKSIEKDFERLSNIEYSYLLELKGVLFAYGKKNDEALKSFKKALKLNDSQRLRSRLSNLRLGDNNDVNLLIKESKALKSIQLSKQHLENNNLKLAMLSALEATSVAPKYIEAKLYLSTLQEKSGLFDEAIKTVEALFKDNPTNPEITFRLTELYISAFKTQEAQRMLADIATTPYKSDYRFYQATAYYYLSKKDFASSVQWLKLAVNKNPINDKIVFDLAKLYIEYKKFKSAKILLNKCMELDPSVIEYKVNYAEIIYELDGTDPAIGYLYDLLKDYPDDPELLGAIGIYYYKSGQLKYYKDIKEKLLSLKVKHRALYEFLMRSAALENKFDIVIQNAKKIIDMYPGDISTRMYLAQVYKEKKMYIEAAKEFKEVESRLDSYPGLQYNLAQINLLLGKIEKAKELAKKEIESNPHSDKGYILLGDIFKQEENFIEAEKQYKSAQRINQQNPDSLIGLAYINFKKSQYEIALDLFRKAKNIDPSRSEVYKYLGDVYRKTGQSRLALESYKTFLELSPNTKYKKLIQQYINQVE